MNMIRRILFGLFMLAAIALPAGSATAENVLDPACQDNPTATICQANNEEQTQQSNSIFGQSGVLTKIARLIAIVIGVAAVIMIIVGGLQYVLASGDPSNITNAKNTILYAIIGVVVALLAQGIISFVLVRI